MAGCAECQVSNTVAAVVLQSRWRGGWCWAAEMEAASEGGRLG